jgi:glutamate-1-semialdehyde 2,1-aminomutase
MNTTKILSRTHSAELYEIAKTYFPGGVNSPVRAFKSVEGTPLFIKKGDGAYIWDEDDNCFIDFCCSWGPLILGHNPTPVRKKIETTLQNGTSFGAPTRLENELAALIINNNSFVEKIRFTSSGTEAVMSAIRLARAYTKRTKIIKFEGCYHGHSDSLLVKAGSGLVTFGESDSAGVPESFAKETLVVPLNDIKAIEKCLADYPEQIACIILEPIPANNGLLLQDKTFLLQLRELCTQNGILLFFDEVISGFRVAFSGAAEWYGIQPDMVTYGKIIGGGLPVGAYGASAEIMRCISPDGPVYQAGTLSGNPIAMAAGIAALSECLKKGFYEDQNHRTAYFVEAINRYAQDKKYAFEMVSLASIFWMNFSHKNIKSANEINNDMEPFKRLHFSLLNKGVYVGPSGYEVGFISKAHTIAILDIAIEAFKVALDEVFAV